MFDKLAHASIMRLNANSMDKLYDLMTMAVKYQVGRFDLKKKKKFAGAQVLMCHNPRHLVSLTLNHLDAILGYVTAASVKVTLHKFVMWTS